MRESGVSKRKDGATVSDRKAVQVPVFQHHFNNGIFRASINDLHSEGL